MNIGIRQDDKGMFWADVQTDEGKISGEKSICWDGQSSLFAQNSTELRTKSRNRRRRGENEPLERNNRNAGKMGLQVG